MIAKKLLAKRPEPDALARNLRAVRAFRGYSQEELALKAGVDRATVSFLENGKHKRPHQGTLDKLAAALDVSVETLKG